MGISVRGLTVFVDVGMDIAIPSPRSCALSRPVYIRPLLRKGWVLRQANFLIHNILPRKTLTFLPCENWMWKDTKCDSETRKGRSKKVKERSREDTKDDSEKI